MLRDWTTVAALAIMLAVAMVLNDPCNERNQPQSDREAALCE